MCAEQSQPSDGKLPISPYFCCLPFNRFSIDSNDEQLWLQSKHLLAVPGVALYLPLKLKIACQASGVKCHNFFVKVVEIVGEGFVINGAYPV